MFKRILLVIFILASIAGYSTHLRSGQIRVVSSDGLKVKIEVLIVTDTRSPIRAGDGILKFGDGTELTLPTIENVTYQDKPNIGFARFVVDHTYTAAGTYLLSYHEPNINGGVLNMFNSVETRFYTETSFVLLPNVSVSSPSFQTEPIFVCASRRPYSFSTAAIDDSTRNDFYYKYSMITPKKDKNQVIGNYVLPDSLEIGKDNGIITWNTRFKGQYTVGLFWVAVRIDKYNKADEHLGYVERAMQIIVEDSDSKIGVTSTVIDSSKRVIATEGQQKKIRIILGDKSQVGNLSFDLHMNKVIKDNVSISQYDSIAGDRKLRVAILTLKTTAGVVSDLPYPITLRGHASYLADITFLFMTKHVDLPGYRPDEPDPVVGLLDEPELTVYPNPFQSELYIDGTSATEATFLNTTGVELMKLPLRAGQPLNASALPGGFYILRVASRSGLNSHVKVVRQ